jgi:hypothetical protein
MMHIPDQDIECPGPGDNQIAAIHSEDERENMLLFISGILTKISPEKAVRMQPHPITGQVISPSGEYR